jgi:protein TonB
MLAYAANAPRPGERRSAPPAMLLIIAAHVAAIAAVMAAKMEVTIRPPDPPIIIKPIPIPEPPPPNVDQKAPPKQDDPRISRIPPIVPLPPTDQPQVNTDPIPQPPVIIDAPGTGTGDGSAINPRVEPVRTGPRFVTPDWALKPPYPDAKLRLEEEASLRLRLTIDSNGRVVGVEPVGKVDPVFFEAARRHLLAKWRYKPATEDGRAIASTTVITLRFQLDDAG